MSAEAQIKSLVDRVLRLKEEQDAIGQDIREVYAEAKARGFDKTQLGNVVAHVRKIEKKGRDAIDEGNAIFDLYLAAYEGTGTPVATRAHTHEAEEPHDPETGEIMESGSNAPAASSSRLTDAAPDESAVAYQESVGVQPAASTSSAAHETDKSAAPILESVQSHEAAVVSEPAESSSGEISATNQPETAKRAPMAVYGDSVEAATAVPSQSVDILPGGDDSSQDRRIEAAPAAPNSNPQASSSRRADKAETAPPPVVSAAFNNPRCREPKSCPNAHSRNSCLECSMAWAERPKEEQVRLWQEAIGAAA